MVRFLLVSIVALWASVACDNRLPEPEKVDPVFSSLSTEIKSVEAGIAKEHKNLEELKKDYEKAAPLSKERTIAKRDSEKSRDKLALLEQNLKYLKIRLERRKIESRRSYRDSHAAGADWPDPREKEFYETAQRLRSASRNWDSRVPKLADRIPSSNPPKEKKK